MLILTPLSANALTQVSKYSSMSISLSLHNTMPSANIIDPGTSFIHLLSTHQPGVGTAMGWRPSVGVVRPPPQSCCSPRPHCALLFCIPGTYIYIWPNVLFRHNSFPCASSYLIPWYAVVCFFNVYVPLCVFQLFVSVRKSHVLCSHRAWIVNLIDTHWMRRRELRLRTSGVNAATEVVSACTKGRHGKCIYGWCAQF